jgi:hypothetical protein
MVSFLWVQHLMIYLNNIQFLQDLYHFHRYKIIEIIFKKIVILFKLWAIAYHQCRWNYNDEDDVRGYV